MDEKVIERIFATGVKTGIQLAKELNMMDENLTPPQAHSIYGKKQIAQWRDKRWIIGYPSGNTQRAKYYYKRSECERAKRMLDLQNIIPDTRINQIINQ